MPKYRAALPQLADQLFLTDGGIETTLIYHDGIELPEFAAFVLLRDEPGTDALRGYFTSYIELARDAGVGLVLETPTWRANPDWAERLGYSISELDALNRSAVELLIDLRSERETAGTPIVVSGCVGPRGDGYNPAELMTPEAAESYHSAQIRTFSHTDADLITAITMTHTGEAIGIARAAAAHEIPIVISFTVETDGRLPSGEFLEAAVRVVDETTSSSPSYFMVNCAHPTHVDTTLTEGTGWQSRVRGLRANASTMTHAELDVAEELDIGDPEDLGARYAQLREHVPSITVLGGCCGTDTRHIEAIGRACLL